MMSDDEDDSDSIIFLEERKVTMPKVTGIECDNESKEPNQQDIIFQGLLDKIKEQHVNFLKIQVHDTDHDHDHLLEKEKPIEIRYICQIPFPKKVPQQTSINAILKSLPEVPISQEETLNNKIHAMVANYRCKELSELNYSYEKDSDSLSRPLKKRKIKF